MNWIEELVQQTLHGAATSRNNNNYFLQRREVAVEVKISLYMRWP